MGRYYIGALFTVGEGFQEKWQVWGGGEPTYMTHLTLMGLTGPPAGCGGATVRAVMKLLPSPSRARFATGSSFQRANKRAHTQIIQIEW